MNELPKSLQNEITTWLAIPRTTRGRRAESKIISKIKLTGTEILVLRMVATGLCNKKMADILGISIKTLEKHRQSVIDKTKIHGCVGLVHWAILNKLVVLGEYVCF